MFSKLLLCLHNNVVEGEHVESSVTMFVNEGFIDVTESKIDLAVDESQTALSTPKKVTTNPKILFHYDVIRLQNYSESNTLTIIIECMTFWY